MKRAAEAERITMGEFVKRAVSARIATAIRTNADESLA
jgi:hypothetical protein